MRAGRSTRTKSPPRSTPACCPRLPPPLRTPCWRTSSIWRRQVGRLVTASDGRTGHVRRATCDELRATCDPEPGTRNPELSSRPPFAGFFGLTRFDVCGAPSWQTRWSSSRYEHEPARALRAQAAECLRSLAFEAFPDFDQARVPEDIEMTAQIAVGEAAQCLQIGEQPSFALSQERGHDPEPRALVHRAIRVPRRRNGGVPKFWVPGPGSGFGVRGSGSRSPCCDPVRVFGLPLPGMILCRRRRPCHFGLQRQVSQRIGAGPTSTWRSVRVDHGRNERATPIRGSRHAASPAAMVDETSATPRRWCSTCAAGCVRCRHVPGAIDLDLWGVA